MYTSYWSCSSFADWVRGTKKINAGTSEEWNAWHLEAKKKHPVRFWIAEEALDAIRDFIWWPVNKIYAIKYYINNRWVTSTHSLRAHPRDIPRGSWCDVGNRFLPCLFNELVEFVEVEQAWHNIAWDKEARAKYNAPFYSWGWLRWRTWRCPEAGLAYLNWAKDLDNSDWLEEDQKHLAEPTAQALAARETLELYNWWKNVYPNRKDPHELSGWSAWCEQRREKIKEEDPDSSSIAFLDSSRESEEEKAETRRILDLCHEIEKQQQDEDEQMLIRLIKIRNSLWT